MWHGKRKKNKLKKPIDPHLETVPGFPDSDEWGIQYRGKIPRNPSGTYVLLCERITEETAATMLDAGSKGVGFGKATHIIFCTVSLAKDKGNPRCLFRLILCLFGAGDTNWQNWLATVITKGLRSKLQTSQEICFLVRCNYSTEFSWCMEHDELDGFWLMEAQVWYRAGMRRIPQ